MLMAVDIGNTHVVIGLYEGEQLLHSWRLRSDRDRTVDEYALEVLALLESAKCRPEMIARIILCCVVPALTRVFVKLGQKYFNHEPFVVGPDTHTGISILYDDPRAVGADRIVNAVAGKKIFGAPVIIVDLGTATTFDVVDENGAYQGGIIAPGVLISAEALFSRAALLPSIEVIRPNQLIGKNTRDSMLSGIVYGYSALVEGLLERLKAEMTAKPRIIATGGLARIIFEETQSIDEIVPDLTLRGLQLLSEMNP